MLKEKGNEPCSSGSDRPGILPASRPCFTSAKLSLGRVNTETPETKRALLFNNKVERFPLSPIIESVSFEVEAVFVLGVSFSDEECNNECEDGRVCKCLEFLQQKAQFVNKAVAMFTMCDRWLRIKV